MITHPLDLASRLRRQPRSFDWVFFVNLGLIALFFVFFGSRFVLSPALVVEDGQFKLPTMPADTVNLVTSSLVISVKSNGQIFVTPNGLVSEAQLKDWLVERGKRMPGARVLIRMDSAVRSDRMASINAAVIDAGLVPAIAIEPSQDGVGR
jgi:Biopolymer transport protein